MDSLYAQSNAIFGLANATLLFAAAVFLTFVPPATRAKRAVALFLAFIGFQALTNLGQLEALSSPGWNPFFADTGGLSAIALAAVVAVYPSPLRGRGWSTALALPFFGTSFILGLVYLFGHGLLPPPPGYDQSFLGPMLVYGLVVTAAGAFSSIVLRSWSLPAAERRAALAVGTALIASVFTRPGAFLFYGLANVVGIPQTNPFNEGLVFGGPVAVVLAVHVLARVVAPAILLVVAGRERFYWPFVLVAFGFVFPDFTSLPSLVSAIVPAYVILRYGALGTPRVAAAWSVFLAGAAALAIFMVSIAITIRLAGDAPIMLAVGVGLGVLVALLAAVLVVLPMTRAWAKDVALTTPAGPAPVGEPLPGDLVLGRYRVVRELGRGGMGAAYLAHDNRIDREVVLKVLRGPDAQEALREARALARVKHPNVVQVQDVENVPDGAVLILEHVDGGSLAQRLERGPLAQDEFASLARDALDALDAVHSAGLVHRDVKPGNVLLTARGQAKLADFGIARRVDGQVTVRGLGAANVAGTLRFVSPEVARGKEATQRSDLFNLGATLFEAWTGEPYLAARPGETAVELQLRAAAAKPLRRRVRGAPALQAWFAQALEPEPAKRFADAASMRAALDEALLTPGSTARSARRR